MSKVKNLLLNSKVILVIILLNSLIIFLQECGIDNSVIRWVDIICTLFFLCEMIMKHIEYGFKFYWQNGWNVLDGVLVLISIPSLVAYIIPLSMYDLSTLMILRILRIFRFFRLVHLFPNFSQIVKNIRLGIKQSFSMFVCFILLVVVVALINCSLFGKICPEYFGNPFESMYSIFRLCTIEGWYEIPDAISTTLNPTLAILVKLYFCIILFAGGIIGLSIVNSIFVDAMVSDNNDEVLQKLEELRNEIKELKANK